MSCCTSTRELFEVYNKGLSLLPTAELPWYRVVLGSSREHDHGDGVLSTYEVTATEILDRIRAEGPLSQPRLRAQAGHRLVVGPHLRDPRGAGGAARSAASSASRGVTAIARYFDLMERLFPADLLAIRPSEQEQRRHKLLSRYRAHGLPGRPGRRRCGTARARRVGQPRPAGLSWTARSCCEGLIADGELLPVNVEGVRGMRYIVVTDARHAG